MLNLSILAGEYYHILRKQTVYETQKTKLFTDPINVIQTKLEKTSDIKEREKIKNILRLVESYNSFVSYLYDSLYNTHTIYINNKFEDFYLQVKNNWDNSFTFSTGKNKVLINIKDYEPDLFLINLIVAKYDEGYVCNYEILEELIDISSKLSNIPNTSDNFIVDKLIDKVDFLIYKLMYRLKKSDNINKYVFYNKVLGNITYSININDRTLNKTFENQIVSASKEINIFLNKYTDKIAKIYKLKSEELSIEDEDDNNDILKNYLSDKQVDNEAIIEKLLNEKSADKLNIEDVHIINKTAKLYSIDWVCKDNKAFENLYKLVKRAYNYIDVINRDNRFDIFAQESYIFLIKNAYFKLNYSLIYNELNSESKISDIVKNIDDLTDLIKHRAEEIDNDIVNTRKDTIDDLLINSKFQFIRFIIDSSIKTINRIEIIVNEIDDIGEKKDLLNIVKAIKRLTTKIYKHTNFSRGYINSALKGRYMPLYLFHDECLVDVDIQRYKNSGYIEYVPKKVLLDSAYILPSNYDLLSRKIEIRISKLQSKDYLFRSEVSRLILENYEAKLDDKVKDNQINALQLIGLYSGFITFILGSISIVPKFEFNYINILLFMFVFASCLSMFVILLRLLFRKREYIRLTKTIKISNTQFAIGFFSLIFGIALVGIYFNRDGNKYESTKKQYSITYDKNGDTIKTQIDSTYTNANFFTKEEDKKK